MILQPSHRYRTIHLVKSMGKKLARTCKIADGEYFNNRKKNAFQMLKWCFVLILDRVNTRRHVENQGIMKLLDMQVFFLELGGLEI
jgi:hypothetical protein